jgi:arylsulfatase A-like enzyme
MVSSANVEKQPNFLWLNTHDLSARHLGCYGDSYAKTPNLDKLSSQGVRYTNAFVSGPICSPSRTSIFTAMHPTTVGTLHHRSFAIRPGFVRLLPYYLMRAGYISTQINTDLNTYIDSDEWSMYLDSSDLWKSRPDDQPFFAVYSFSESHASTFKMDPEEVRLQRSNLLQDEELHDPDQAPIPSFVPNTPLARERMALFYDTVTQVDYHVGDVLGKLEQHGFAEDTIVFFWADHGSGYPRAKTHVYDDGLQVPLIIRFPEKYQHFAPSLSGTVVDDFVMLMDLGPSILSLAGIMNPEHFQGQAFLGPQKCEPREYVCSARDRLDNCNEMIRTTRNKKYRYIRNFLPHRPYASFYPDGGFFEQIPLEGTPARDFWETSCLPKEQKIHDPDGVFLMPIPENYAEYLIWQDSKPYEELYDIDNDPEEINNLANDPKYLDVVRKMRRELYEWMIDTRDLGLFDETEMIVRAGQYDGINYEVGARCRNLERILQTADLSRRGEDGRIKLVERLDDSDSAVRYWAVTGLMSYDMDNNITRKLKHLLRDESLSVSLAASDSLCQTGWVDITIPALRNALQSDLLWARFRAAANLSYYGREQLSQMKSLIPDLQTALRNSSCYDLEHLPYIESMFSQHSFNAQRDTIVGVWVIGRVIKRIQLA